MSDFPVPSPAEKRRLLWLQLEKLCDRFETDWKQGNPPPLESLLEEAPGEAHPELFRNLLTIERDYRRQQGQALSITEVRRRFGGLGIWVEAALGELGLTDLDATLTLEVEAGPAKGQSLRLSGHAYFLVGRGPGVHLPLEGDPLLSRVHFSIEYNPPSARLTDMRSRNGTLVNDQKVERFDLRDGDRIKVGNTVLRVVMPGVLTLVPEGENASVGTGVRPSLGEEIRADSVTLPGYTIEAELGQGGMGRVYRARRDGDGLTVAIKTISPAVAPRAELVARFEREMTILQRLNHPGIVRHLFSGETRGILYFVMEYIDGVDAGRMVKSQGPMDPERVVGLTCQLLDALEYAHGRGVVHRDIKPGNLLLQGQGEQEILKLADFGLARAYQASAMSGLTMSGESGGTPEFMPPEQVTDFRGARPAADQYGVAATMYYLLTGKAVYERTKSRVEMLLRIAQSDPIPLRAGGENALPGRLGEVVRRALQRQPEARYADVRAMRAALLG